MPTSGGGGHGGFGGGFHGGGFHGGGYRGPRGPRFGGFWFFGPRFYYGGGLLGWFFAPIILLVISLVLIAVILLSLAATIGQKTVDYSESAAEDYALEQYEQAFGGEKGYEDKILLAFFTYEDGLEYRYITMNGDHLTNRVYNMMLGDSRSALSKAMRANISSTSYETTLGRNLSGVVEDLTGSVGAETKIFTCSETTHADGKSYLRNDSGLTVNAEMVNAALADFTAQTGIEMVIVVDEAAEVFGYETPIPGIIALVFLLALVGISIYFIVRNAKAKKNGGNGQNGGSNGSGATFNGNPRTDSDPYGQDNW